MSTHDDVICFPVGCHSMVVTYYNAVSLNLVVAYYNAVKLNLSGSSNCNTVYWSQSRVSGSNSWPVSGPWTRVTQYSVLSGVAEWIKWIFWKYIYSTQCNGGDLLCSVTQNDGAAYYNAVATEKLNLSGSNNCNTVCWRQDGVSGSNSWAVSGSWSWVTQYSVLSWVAELLGGFFGYKYM